MFLSRPSRPSKRNQFVPKLEDLEQRWNPATIQSSGLESGLGDGLGLYMTQYVDSSSPNSSGNSAMQLYMFGSNAEIDVVFEATASQGTTVYEFMSTVYNAVGSDWDHVTIQLGFGTGSSFAEAGSSSGLSFGGSPDVWGASSGPTIVAANTSIDYSDFTQAEWDAFTYVYQINTGDVDPGQIPSGYVTVDGSGNLVSYSFTLRITPMMEPPPPPPPSDPSPEITNLSISYGTGHTVTVTGTVSDNTPGGLSVEFTGVIAGSAVTDGSGNFTFTAQASALGEIQVLVTDQANNTSDPGFITVANSIPIIQNFSASYTGADNIWVFSGQVIDEHAEDLQVALDGLPSLLGCTLTCDEDGYFWYSIMLEPNEEGLVGALTTDWWGLSSDAVYALV